MVPSPREHQFVEVDLSAIENNVRAFAKHTSRPVLTVVKANAYGHGSVPIAKAVLKAGGAYLGVTSLAEARLLRHGEVGGRILVMGPQRPDEYREALRLDTECVIWTQEQADALDRIAADSGRKISVHVKVDVGMSRFGILPNEAGEFLRSLRTKEHLDVKGLTSHLSASDEDEGITRNQQQTMLELIRHLESAGLRPPVVHIANSGASSAYPDLWFDMVRIGIVLYGYPTHPESSVSNQLRPALSWKASLVSIRKFPANTLVSYGGEYRTTQEETIGVISVGYTDGFRRVPKNCNEVIIRGVRRKVIGRVCQQFCMVQLGHGADVNLWDDVTILGRDGNESLSATDLARRWGTNEWDVLCSINPLVERRYRS